MKPERLYLKESAITNAYEFIHKFAENFIFFRWTYFKNRPRSTFLLIRSIMINGLIFGAYYKLFSHFNFLLMGVDVNPVLLFSASTFLGYWSMSSNFGQKTNYLSQLYNDLVKYDFQGDSNGLLLLKLNFCAQLLTMDLWGHRLYSWVFVDTLELAAKWNIEKQKCGFNSFEEYEEVSASGKLTVSMARNMILNYQKHLTFNNHNYDGIKLVSKSA